MIKRSSLLRILAAALLGVALTIGGISAASADTDFAVVGTDIGIYRRTAPSMDASKVGEALTDGSVVTVSCELPGQLVDNGYAPSDAWMRLSDGTYLPNAFIMTGHDGWTPGLSRCDQGTASPPEAAPAPAPTPAPAEQPKVYEGQPISDSDVSTQLIQWYYGGDGAPVVVAWSYFARDQRLMSELRALEFPLGYKTYQSNPADDGDIYYSLGAFTIARTSANCFAIKDSYDFFPNKWANVPYIFSWLDTFFAGAKPFTVQSSGCLAQF